MHWVTLSALRYAVCNSVAIDYTTIDYTTGSARLSPVAASPHVLRSLLRS